MVRPGPWLVALALALPAWVAAAQDAGRWPRPPVSRSPFGSTTDELLPVGGQPAWLVASADLTQGYGVRFRAAPIDGGHRGRLIALGSRVDVRTQPLDDGGRKPAQSRFSAPPHPDFVPDAAPAFTVTPVLTRGRLTIVTVTAAEGDADSTKRSVWAVGLERTPTGLVGDVLPLAFDGATYNGCRRHLQPATAVAVAARSAPPGLTLGVEPAYEWDQVEEDEPLGALEARELGCRARLVVGWTPGGGFAVTSRRMQCGGPPRRVTISPGGELTSRPGLRAAPRARPGGDE
jgi:hypothetical protein